MRRLDGTANIEVGVEIDDDEGIGEYGDNNVVVDIEDGFKEGGGGGIDNGGGVDRGGFGAGERDEKGNNIGPNTGIRTGTTTGTNAALCSAADPWNCARVEDGHVDGSGGDDGCSDYEGDGDPGDGGDGDPESGRPGMVSRPSPRGVFCRVGGCIAIATVAKSRWMPLNNNIFNATCADKGGWNSEDGCNAFYRAEIIIC